ncbi:MAG: DEAD/DEAH box helicase, partial [Poseidonibacter sp.]
KEGVAVSIVTPHEFRMLQKIEKNIGTKLESKIVPNIDSVKEKKVTALKEEIKAQEIKNYALELVEDLKEDFDISTIAFKLASMLTASTHVQGTNTIGKSESDIQRLIENAQRGGGDDRGGRGGNRGGRGGYRGGNRGGSRGSDSRGGRSGGGRSDGRSSGGRSDGRSSGGRSDGRSGGGERNRRRD